MPDRLPARTIELSADLYSVSAVKKAAYKFSDRLFVEFDALGDRKITMTLRSKDASTDFESVCGELLNEALDQDLRESIARETEALRNLILAHALSRVALLHADLEEADFRLAPELNSTSS